MKFWNERIILSNDYYSTIGLHHSYLKINL